MTSPRLKSGRRAPQRVKHSFKMYNLQYSVPNTLIVALKKTFTTALELDQRSALDAGLSRSWRLPRRGTQPETALGGLESRHKLRCRDTFVRAWGLILGIERTANTSPQRMLLTRRTTSQI